MTYLSAFLLLFIVMDPIGNIPLFAAALRAVPAWKRTRIVVRELLIALAILIGFLFLGPATLRLMHITPAALEVGGAIVLFLIALRMVFPPEREAKEGEMGPEPFIVPLAVPLIAGPGAIATLLLIVGQQHSGWSGKSIALAALLSAWGVSALILIAASRLSSLLGPRTMQALERLMGMLLVTLSVQMAMTGIEKYIDAAYTHPA
jgi:multiple antibiotic resistance protein